MHNEVDDTLTPHPRMYAADTDMLTEQWTSWETPCIVVGPLVADSHSGVYHVSVLNILQTCGHCGYT